MVYQSPAVAGYWRHPLWLIVVLVFCASCASVPVPGGDTFTPSRDSIAVLGVVSAQSNLSAFKRKDYVNKLEAQIRAQQPDYTLVPNHDVRRYLAERHGDRNSLSLLLGQFKLHGQLTPENVQVLRQQQVPVRYVALARIEQNETQKFREINRGLRNSRGELLTDRHEVALIHQRSVQVSARVYDVASGREVWSEHYTSKPETKNVYVEYTGSSFVGSVAISLANSFVKGRAASRFPTAPREAEAVTATFRRIAQRLLKR